VQNKIIFSSFELDNIQLIIVKRYFVSSKSEKTKIFIYYNSNSNELKRIMFCHVHALAFNT
jgi:hypothetical protein